jgi:hypothetical protein
MRAQAVPWDDAAQVALARTEVAVSAGAAAALDRLSRAAGSAAAPYARRVEAARAFAAAGGQAAAAPQTEIERLRAAAQLATGGDDLVDARLAASEGAAGATAAAALLRPAVAAAPTRLDVRLALVRAELAAGRAPAAIEAMRPVVPQVRALAGMGLSDQEQRRLARELGDAYAQSGDPMEAASYYDFALNGQPPGALPDVRARLDAVNADIRRRQENDQRRPEVSASVTQPRLVRPRLEAPAPVATIAGGGRP